MNQNEPAGKITFAATDCRDDDFWMIYDVFTVEANGQNLKQLTPGEEWLSSPSYSPDGTKIAFIAENDNENDMDDGIEDSDEYWLYIMNSDGSERRLLTKMTMGRFDTPCFSPDGKQILFAHDDVFIIDVDGTNSRRIPVEGHASSAVFTVDGLNIIYTFSRVTKTWYKEVLKYEPIGFLIMNLDGSNQRLLFPFSRLGPNCQEWVISPDGSKIAYVSYTLSECTVPMVEKSWVNIVDLVSDTAALEPRKLSEGFDNAGGPTFNPDSTHVAFVNHKNKESRAYTIQVDGSDLRPLTDGIWPTLSDFSPSAWVK